MSFVIKGLDPELVRPFFGLDESALAARNGRRYAVTQANAFPDRIALRFAAPGETVLLVNYLHQPAETPYRASHAVFVREGANDRYEAADEIPPILQTNVISLRGFDAAGMLAGADLAQGDALAPAIERLLDNPAVAEIHAHFAKWGCYAAQIARA